MKYLEIFENFKDIDAICEEYGIENYTINKDGSVDVYGNVDLSYKKLKELPLNFGRVNGYFICSHNSLTTLEGCPREVGGSFYCYNNSLTTLEGGPREVGGSFNCNNNSLTTLEGGPREVSGSFYCFDNSLTTLEGCPREVGGYFDCSYNSLTTLEGCPKKVGGVFNCDDNPLPQEIYDNIRYIKTILKYQDDYSIWNRDKSLNHYRFKEMMEEILEEES